MPELAQQREAAEAEFQRRLNQLGERYRPRIVAAMGDPPDPANVPESLWQEVEQDYRDRTFWQVIAIMLTAYNNLHAEWESPALPDVQAATIDDLPTVAGQGDIVLPPADRVELQTATAWATNRSEQLSAGLVSTSRKILDRAAEKIRKVDPQSAPRRQRAEVRDIRDKAMEDIFGDKRNERIAATEVTGAISAGEDAIRRRVEIGLGWEITKFWQTERDDNVCPICRPNHGQPEEFYLPRTGPPPSHISCRCWEIYKVLSRQPASQNSPAVTA